MQGQLALAILQGMCKCTIAYAVLTLSLSYSAA